MKKLFFIIGLFFSLSAMAQPTNYTKINMRYRWLSGMFDSALYVPRYNGTPSGVRVNETSVFDGMVAMDTTNNRLYIYSGGAWVRLANYSEIAAYTAGNGLTLSGSQFKLGGTLTDDTTLINQDNKRLRFYGNETMFDSLRLTSAGESDYTIRHRLVGLGFPVPTIKPTGNSSKNIAFDIMPTGTPGNYSNNGIAWIDVCDSDVSAGAGATATARVGITSSAVQFGSRAFGGASDKPIQFVIGSSTKAQIDASTNTGSFNIGKITQSQAISGDYVGYSLFNTNNSVAESNPIFFIGQDIGALNFGYIRWNNNATTPNTYRQPNGLEIMANAGATGGLSIGVLGGVSERTGKHIKFFVSTSEKMRIDSAGNVGIGTSTPNASALLDVTSTTQGAVLPRMNTTQMNAISSPVAGLMVYNSDSASYCFYNGTAWLKMGSGSGGGGGTPAGSAKQFQYNNAGAFAGSGMLTQETDQILITGNSSASTPPFRVDAHEDLTDEIVNISQSGAKKFALHSNGSIEMAKSSLPSTPEAGYLRLTVNSDNSKLYTTNDAGKSAQLIQDLQLVFGAGSGADSDTTAFTTSAIYGSFYNDADTIVVTSFKAVLQGTSPDVTYKIWYNDSLNVEAGATALNTAGNQVTSTTTGTNVTSITNTKIPPGVWVWVKTSTVATKPKYFSLTVNGYRK